MNSCMVFTSGGLVLWERHFQQQGSVKKIFTSFANEALIEKSRVTAAAGVGFNEVESYHNSGYTVRYAIANDLGLVFAAAYQSILQLSYIEEFVQNLKKIFMAMFSDQLLQQSKNRGVMGLDTSDMKEDVSKFTYMIEARLSELESTDDSTNNGTATEHASSSLNNKEESPFSGQSEDEDDSRDQSSTGVSTPTNGGGQSRRRRGGKKSKHNKESVKDASAKPKKQMRRWGEDGMMDDYDHDTPLDYSMDDGSKAGDRGAVNSSLVSETMSSMKNWGSTQKDGLFVLNELHSILDGENNNNINGNNSGRDNSAGSGGAGQKAFGFLQNFVGGKTLTPEDLEKALSAMETHLLQKNVAKEAADYLCSVVRKNLVGSKTQSWTTVQATVKSSMSEALRQILTPNTSLDLLHEIETKRKRKGDDQRPYVISVVGVNGVGKSTNLSKIAFWLLQSKMKVLIAACDTFRSGAVEQLKVHVDRLQELTSRVGSGEVDIFTEGYGKDAADIARRAIEYGQRNRFDVVLIDTAGRRHNDDRLMSSLEKFGKLANPDKIIMVGEALVGTDSVQQAKNFNAAFGKNRDLDFFLISKCDTVGDMIGSMVNMTYSTGIPVLFVGVGQNYTDLRTLSIDWAVNLLMS